MNEIIVRFDKMMGGNKKMEKREMQARYTWLGVGVGVGVGLGVGGRKMEKREMQARCDPRRTSRRTSHPAPVHLPPDPGGTLTLTPTPTPNPNPGAPLAAGGGDARLRSDRLERLGCLGPLR